MEDAKLKISLTSPFERLLEDKSVTLMLRLLNHAALSQISRAVETRNNKRPTMADLSQSGILEMVADNILMAYRDDYYNPDTPDREVLELIVSKSRHGSTGTVRCLFDKSYGLIKNMREWP